MLFGGATPLKSRSTLPQQPDTAARLLSTEVDDVDEPRTPHLQKVTPTTLSAPLPFPCVACTSREPSHTRTSSPSCTSKNQTSTHSGKAPGRNGSKVDNAAAVPPLQAESLNLSLITSGVSSPYSEWSNKTEKHLGIGAAQQQPQQEMQRLSALTACSDDRSLQERSHVCDSVSSPTVCKSTSSAAQDTSSTDDTMRPEHTDASAPLLSASSPHASRTSVKFIAAAATATGATAVISTSGPCSEASPSLAKPANILQTPEEVVDHPDLSSYTVSTTSVGGIVTPMLAQGRTNVWLCDVSREEEQPEEEGDDGDESDNRPTDSPQQKRALLRTTAANAAGKGDGSDSDELFNALDSPNGSVQRFLFPHATEAYISTHPSAAPFSSTSVSASFSPLQAQASLTDRVFATQYPLFQPHVYSPHQGGLQVPAAHATPSHTDLPTNIFSESTAGQTLPQFDSKPVPLEVEPHHHHQVSSKSPLCTLQSPERQRLQNAPAPQHRPVTAEAPNLFCHMTPSRSLRSGSHPTLSASPEDMGTQVFCSGTHVHSPIQQRRHITQSRFTFVGDTGSTSSSPAPPKFAYGRFCSPPRTHATPTRHHLRDGATAALFPPPQRPSPHSLVDNLFLEDTISSLRSQPDTTDHSGLRSPRNVSAVVELHMSSGVGGGCGSDRSGSVTSTPLLLSLERGSCGGRSPSLSGATGPPADVACHVHRSDTPKSPHTPLDRRTPGPVGLQGSGYASLSECSYGVSQQQHRLQPMTPQKSARRTYSRQTTPSQSFRSKVQSHSFESQQPLHQQQSVQFFNSQTSGLWPATGHANTSVTSVALGEATIVAERDYLAPSRNPFSLYRSFEMYGRRLLQCESSTEKAEAKALEGSASSDATTEVHSSINGGEQPLTEKQRRLVEELPTAVLRPDAAVVLYEQLIPAPTRAPGSHRLKSKVPSPSQDALDLLLHAPQARRRHAFTPSSLTLSLSGRGTQGQACSGAPAATAAGQAGGVADHRYGAQDCRNVEATPPCAHCDSLATHFNSGRTVPHRKACLLNVRNSGTSVAAAAVSASLRPRVTLTNCSPRQAPTTTTAAAAGFSLPPSRTPSCALTRQQQQQQQSTEAALIDTPIGVRCAAPCSPNVSHSPHPSPGAASTSSVTSSLAAMPIHSPSETFNSLTTLDEDTDARVTNGNEATTLDGSHISYDGLNNEDLSPPPRRPSSKFGGMGECDSATPPSGNPICPERQLLFSAGDTEEEDNEPAKPEQEKKACVLESSSGAAAAAADLSSPVVLAAAESSPIAVSHEKSTSTEHSGFGSPHFLCHTVANVSSAAEKPSSPVQLQRNLHDALRARAEENKRDRTHATTLLPPASVSAAPTGTLFDFLKSPNLPPSQQEQKQSQRQRQCTPSQEMPGLCLSTESSLANRENGNNTSAIVSSGRQAAPRGISTDQVRGSNEVASLLSPPTYQALNSGQDLLDVTDTSEEEIPGDRFQAHHAFQFLHYVEAAVAASGVTAGATPANSVMRAAAAAAAAATHHAGGGRPIPLCVEVNGVTWLATHRLNGLPYAVKEVPAVAFNTAELQCLTLSNCSHHSLHKTATHGVAPQDMLEAEDYLARYYSVSTPPQDSSKPVVHLLQLEYFPRGSVHDLVQRCIEMNSISHDPSNQRCGCQSDLHVRGCLADFAHAPSLTPVLNCDFWEQVMQQGLRGLRALHHARLLHGCPLPNCLFLTGHTSASLHVKWSCFGSARANADVYPTESLPPWISDAVALLYKQHDGEVAVRPDVIEVAVFCLGLLELLVEETQEQDRRKGVPVPPPRTAAGDGLRRLEWMEVMVRRPRSDTSDATVRAEEAQLQTLMQFLWNTANGYGDADAVLAQMAVSIDPALRTVEDLYQYELDRLTRLLQEKQQQSIKLRLHTASGLTSTPPSGNQHARTASTVSQASMELPPARSQQANSSYSTARTGSAANLNLTSPNLAAGHGLTHTMGAAPPFGAAQSASSGLHKSPQLLPCRASVPSSHIARTSFLDTSSERQLPSLGGGASGALFLPLSADSAKPAVASAPMHSFRVDRSTSIVSTRGGVTGRHRRRGVPPRVQEAACRMLLNSLVSPARAGEEEAETSSTSPSLWKAMLEPAVHSLRLRRWTSLYAGLPLTVAGAGTVPGSTKKEKEETALRTLLMSLRPMTSFE